MAISPMRWGREDEFVRNLGVDDAWALVVELSGLVRESGTVREWEAVGRITSRLERSGVGGSLPDVAFATGLGIPVFDVPYGSPDQRNHAPNENLRLERLRQGVATSANLLLRAAGRLSSATVAP